MSSELKLCPFCGADAKLEGIRIGVRDFIFASCTKCKGRTGACAYEQEAIDEWNHRINDPTQ
jgi:Lar family restriction alleviation protein